MILRPLVGLIYTSVTLLWAISLTFRASQLCKEGLQSWRYSGVESQPKKRVTHFHVCEQKQPGEEERPLDAGSEAPVQSWLYCLFKPSPSARHANSLTFNHVAYKTETTLYLPPSEKNVRIKWDMSQSWNHNRLFLRLANIYWAFTNSKEFYKMPYRRYIIFRVPALQDEKTECK